MIYIIIYILSFIICFGSLAYIAYKHEGCIRLGELLLFIIISGTPYVATMLIIMMFVSGIFYYISTINKDWLWRILNKKIIGRNTIKKHNDNYSIK